MDPASGPDADRSEREADATSVLARRCAGVIDPKVRVAYVADHLRRATPAEVVELLAAAQAGAPRIPAYADLLLALALALSEPETEPTRRESALLASAAGLTSVVEMLGQHDPATPELGELRVPDFGTGRPLTLGERKSLARRRDRGLLARVLRDPHPEVIAVLLDNPALTELDVVRLAARRPIDPQSLRHVFLNPRWAVRYEVRRALLQNPYCPLDVALKLVPLLKRSDAAAFARAPSLRTPIREACARVARQSLQ